LSPKIYNLNDVGIFFNGYYSLILNKAGQIYFIS